MIYRLLKALYFLCGLLCLPILLWAALSHSLISLICTLIFGSICLFPHFIALVTWIVTGKADTRLLDFLMELK
jgi:hypothetical protein